MMFGINAPRKGQTAASAGKFVSQQAEYRGSMMSEHLFTQMDELHQTDLQGLVDLSQIAFASGKKAMFLSSDFKQAFLDVNPVIYSTAEYGVGVNNSSRATEKLNKMDMVIQALAQDPNVPKTAIPKLIDADNMAGLILELETIMEENDAKQAANQQALNQIEQQKTETAKLIAQEANDLRKYEIDENNATKVEVAIIASDTAMQTVPQAPEVSNDGEIKTNLTNLTNQSKERLEYMKVLAAKRIQDSKERSEKYKADMAFKVAKENKPARPAK
jgi:hypothetical protein